MSDEKKFILCKKCGSILEKGVTFCGYCGAAVEELATQDQIETSKQTPFKEQNFFYTQPVQPPTQRKVFLIDDSISTNENYESKVRLVTIFSWLTLCTTFLSPIFYILTLIYAYKARKIGGRDQRVSQAILFATFYFILNIASNIFLYWYLFTIIFGV